MRIIGGTVGGRTLKVPKGMGVRPTPDRVREAIFNSLASRVVDARVLELFGGSGALSLECLSRGAKSAVCVEKSAKHAGFIRSNCRDVGLSSIGFTVRVSDVFPAMSQLLVDRAEFDLVLADPPFGAKNNKERSKSFSQKVLDDTKLPKLIATSGLFVLGHAKRDSVEVPETWEEIKVLKHGDSIFRMLKVAEQTEEQPLLEPVT
jgi:16S rRNA (guanine966-N2)-methyltransferase